MPAEIKTLLAGHLDLVPKLFEFLEQAEAHNFGGEGSGNWGHEGRPGEVGGSGEGGAGVGTVTGSDVDKLQTQVDSWSGTENRAIATSALQNTGNTNIDVIALKSGDKLAAVAAIESKPGTDYLKVKDIASNEKGGGTRIMAEVARMAASKGKGVALVSMTTSASGFYKKIGMVPDKANDSIYRWTAEQAKGFSKKSFSEFGGEGSGNWGHGGRPGEIGGSGEGGGSAEPKSLLQQVEDKMRAEGTLPAAASKVEATKAVEAPKGTPKPTQEELKVLEDKSDSLIAKFDKATSKTRDKIEAKENVATENKESLKYLESSKKMSETELRSGIDKVFGEGSSKDIDILHVADVHASIEHNVAIMGEKAFKESVSSIKSVSQEYLTQHGSKGDATIAAYNPNTKEIYINRDISVTTTIANNIENNSTSTNFHVKSGNPASIKMSVDHEIGHAIFHGTTSKDSQEKIGKVFDKAGRYTLSKLVSKYSAYTVDELSAEAWSSRMNNGSVNSIVGNVAALMGDAR